MAIKERDVVLVSTNESNDTIIDMPVTRENCVEGLGRIRGTAYSVGDVALCAGSMSLQLICTVAGTTSTDELDITGNVAGDSIADGTVTWIVAKRNYFNNDGVLPISEGGTGANNVSDARNNLGLGNTDGALPIANGGTGANNASDACANLGALPLRGGTLSGALAVKKGSNWGQFIAYSASGYYRAFEASDECIRLDIRNNLTTDNRRFFQISNSIGSADIRSAIILTDSVNGVETSYKILGEHNTKAYITETWSNGDSWYRKYSDGWVEQGGIVDIEAFTQKIDKTITLNTPMANNAYSVNLQILNGGNYWSVVQGVNVGVRALTSFTINLHQAQTSGYVDVDSHRRMWEVKGWGA